MFFQTFHMAFLSNKKLKSGKKISIQNYHLSVQKKKNLLGGLSLSLSGHGLVEVVQVEIVRRAAEDEASGLEVLVGDGEQRDKRSQETVSADGRAVTGGCGASPHARG